MKALLYQRGFGGKLILFKELDIDPSVQMIRIPIPPEMQVVVLPPFDVFKPPEIKAVEFKRIGNTPLEEALFLAQ